MLKKIIINIKYLLLLLFIILILNNNKPNVRSCHKYKKKSNNETKQFCFPCKETSFSIYDKYLKN